MAAKKEDLNVRRALERQGAKGVGMFDNDEGSDGAEDVEMQGTERDKVRIAQAEKRRTRHGLVEDVEEVKETPVVHSSWPVAGSKKRRTGGKVRTFRGSVATFLQSLMRPDFQQAAWSAGLISTQPEPESDFDSSDSANDSSEDDEQEMAPAQEASPPAPVKEEAPAVPGVKAPAPAAALPAQTGLGSALARDPSGATAPIKVVVREKKLKKVNEHVHGLGPYVSSDLYF